MLKQLLAALLALTLAIGWLAGVIGVLGTTPSIMLALMQRHAPSESTYLPAAEYPAMAEMITGYLGGRVETFQHAFTMDGTGYLAFRSHEQQHMADCRALFALARRVGWTAAGLSVLLGAALLLMRRRPGSARRGFLAGLLGLMGLLAALAVWAAVDFDGAFVLFHRLSFTNELWLLQPERDLLIRLMPTSFFMHYAALLGLLWLAGMLCMLLPALMRRKGHRKTRQNP